MMMQGDNGIFWLAKDTHDSSIERYIRNRADSPSRRTLPSVGRDTSCRFSGHQLLRNDALPLGVMKCNYPYSWM